MGISDTNDKRKHTRVEFTTFVTIQVESSDEIIKLKGSTKDLSLKGMFAGTDHRLVPGTKCDVTVTLTGSIDKIELNIQGTVVREGSKGMGIAFDAMDVDTYSHLKNIVNYNKIDG